MALDRADPPPSLSGAFVAVTPPPAPNAQREPSQRTRRLASPGGLLLSTMRAEKDGSQAALNRWPLAPSGKSIERSSLPLPMFPISYNATGSNQGPASPGAATWLTGTRQQPPGALARQWVQTARRTILAISMVSQC